MRLACLLLWCALLSLPSAEACYSTYDWSMPVGKHHLLVILRRAGEHRPGFDDYPSSGLYLRDSTTPIWTVNEYLWPGTCSVSANRRYLVGYVLGGRGWHAWISIYDRGRRTGRHAVEPIRGPLSRWVDDQPWLTTPREHVFDAETQYYTWTTRTHEKHVFDASTGERVGRHRPLFWLVVGLGMLLSAVANILSNPRPGLALWGVQLASCLCLAELLV